MASARLPPLQMHQEIFSPTTSQPKSILQTLKANTHQVLFRPPTTVSSPSPLKKIIPRRHQSFQDTRVLPQEFCANVVEPSSVTLKPIHTDVRATDNLMKRPPITIFDTAIPPRKPPQAAFFTSFPTSKSSVGKENIAPNSIFKDISKITTNIAPKRKDSVSKASTTRVLEEAAPTRTEQEREKDALGSSSDIIPAPEDMPPVVDDGKKPPYSYATLIGMAILRSPGRRLTLAQIYKWISDTFQYYRTSESGWQNSIRHNLSLNKAFKKQERPKDDPGKGHYWTIVPGEEKPFFNRKSGRRPASGHNKKASIPTASAKRRSSVIPNLSEAFDLRPAEVVIEELLPKALDSAATIEENEIEERVASFEETASVSSDATINASPEPDQILFLEDPFRPSSPLINHSSPPPNSTILHSSPPVPRVQIVRDPTPPLLPPTRKRKSSQMNDSGYFSSLSSSVQRQSMNEDRHRIKRGRAEEDIARLRSFSHFHETPIPKSKFPGNPGSLISSPLRINESNRMLPPLTPATTLLRPRQKTPLSASPNTNLRLHREMVRRMVGSPCRDVPLLEDEEWTTFFTTYQDVKYFEAEEHRDGDEILSKPYNGSPIRTGLKNRDFKRGCSSATELVPLSELDTYDGIYGSVKSATQRIRRILEETGSPRPTIKRSETAIF